jgi:hypothetical protein
VNESIESILRSSYVFWQRGHTTPDGQDFMRLYHVTEDRLPHICIIDPRTGANLFNWTVQTNLKHLLMFFNFYILGIH